jgi:hypothetical protein
MDCAVTELNIKVDKKQKNRNGFIVFSLVKKLKLRFYLKSGAGALESAGMQIVIDGL